MTPNQASVWAYLQAYFAREGRSPKRIEMVEALGMPSSTVQDCLGALQRQGLIYRARYGRVIERRAA
jgi:DNA-binding IclR family transcriptional regulator